MRFYRYISVLLLAILFTSLADGQDTKIKCPDTVVINSFITTYGFSYKDINTVTVKLFPKNSRFKAGMETMSFQVVSTDVLADSLRQIRYIDIGSKQQINNTVDLEIIIDTNNVFKITDVKTAIIIERNQFKRCRMVSYTLNGVKHNANNIELVKKGFKKKKIIEPKKPTNPNEKHRMIL